MVTSIFDSTKYKGKPTLGSPCYVVGYVSGGNSPTVIMTYVKSVSLEKCEYFFTVVNDTCKGKVYFNVENAYKKYRSLWVNILKRHVEIVISLKTKLKNSINLKQFNELINKSEDKADRYYDAFGLVDGNLSEYEYNDDDGTVVIDVTQKPKFNVGDTVYIVVVPDSSNIYGRIPDNTYDIVETIVNKISLQHWGISYSFDYQYRTKDEHIFKNRDDAVKHRQSLLKDKIDIFQSLKKNGADYD